MQTTCSPHVLSLEFHVISSKSMVNLLSYCGLVDVKIRASDIDLPVTFSKNATVENLKYYRVYHLDLM